MLLSILSLSAVIVACEKKVDPVDSYGVTVDYKSTSSKSVTGDVELNANDSISFDFTITSSKEDISVVEIQKNSFKIDTIKMAGSGVRTFTGSKKYQVDSINGDCTYRILS